MTNLTGSEKQVKWAAEIQRRFTAIIDQAAARFESVGNDGDAAKLRSGLATLVAQHGDAAWWIDHDGTLRNELKAVLL